MTDRAGESADKRRLARGSSGSVQDRAGLSAPRRSGFSLTLEEYRPQKTSG